MKNFALIAISLFLLLGAYAQQPKKEIKVDPLLIERLGIEKVNEMRANNPRQLIIENIELTHSSGLTTKLWENDGSYKMMGDLKQYVKAGKSCNYQDIIEKGYVNRDDFQIEADKYLGTMYTLGNTGYYLYVQSKAWMEDHKQAVLEDYGL